MARPAHIAYLFSRFPVVSQTFCDSEMLALEATGDTVTVGSLNPPTTSFRHERLANLRAHVCYPPPARVLKALEAQAKADGSWQPLEAMVRRHESDYGASFKPDVRARNALYFARQFRKLGVEHVHVHFANRATHTALFLKALGLPFSFTAHAQDFMVDLGSDALLAEMCDEAEFVVAVSDFSRDLLRRTCPASADKIHRVYNGIRPEDFPAARPAVDGVLRIVSVGRLIEFKGFHHLIGACGRLARDGVAFECTIIGDGPWLEKLEARAQEEGVADRVRFAGIRSQEEVKAELARSDVFCLPSILDSKGASDILPTVIMEAMACRLPVVATDFVGIPEMVAHGESGLLVPPGDEAALAGALRQLADAPDRARQLGENGRARAEEIFSLRTTAAQLRALMARTLAPAEPAARPEAVYLVAAFPPDGRLQQDEEIAVACELPTLLPLVADLSKPSAVDGSPVAAAAEFFPDGIVLEAEWRNAPAGTVERLESLRTDLGTAVSGEMFFRDARRAVWLAATMRRRGIARVHASRSSSLLCAWLVRQLTGAALSAAIEDDPATSPSLIERLAQDADTLSVSDATLRQRISGAKDSLGLKILPDHRRLGIGSLSFKVRQRETDATRQARQSAAREWLTRLLSP